jgi:hypothetical protein
MAGKRKKTQREALDKTQRDTHAQRVEMLRAIAAWEGQDPDRAARLRAEARTLAKDPDFADMVKHAECCEEIANTVTAKKEAYREKQVRAQRSPKRVIKKRWHEDADPIVNELHKKNPGWKATRLREALEEQWGSKPGRPDLPEPRAINRHIEKLLNQGDLAGEAK